MDENELPDEVVKDTVKKIERIMKSFLKLAKEKWPETIPTVTLFFDESELCLGYVIKDNDSETYAKQWVLYAKKYGSPFILQCMNISDDNNPHNGRLSISHLPTQIVSHYLHKIEYKTPVGWEEIW